MPPRRVRPRATSRRTESPRSTCGERAASLPDTGRSVGRGAERPGPRGRRRAGRRRGPHRAPGRARDPAAVRHRLGPARPDLPPGQRVGRARHGQLQRHLRGPDPPAAGRAPRAQGRRRRPAGRRQPDLRGRGGGAQVAAGGRRDRRAPPPWPAGWSTTCSSRWAAPRWPGWWWPAGPLRGQSLALALPDRPYRVGRSPDCDLVLPDDDVSREHAAFERRWQGVFVRDLGLEERRADRRAEGPGRAAACTTATSHGRDHPAAGGRPGRELPAPDGREGQGVGRARPPPGRGVAPVPAPAACRRAPRPRARRRPGRAGRRPRRPAPRQARPATPGRASRRGAGDRRPRPRGAAARRGRAPASGASGSRILTLLVSAFAAGGAGRGALPGLRDVGGDGRGERRTLAGPRSVSSPVYKQLVWGGRRMEAWRQDLPAGAHRRVVGSLRPPRRHGRGGRGAAGRPLLADLVAALAGSAGGARGSRAGPSP